MPTAVLRTILDRKSTPRVSVVRRVLPTIAIWIIREIEEEILCKLPSVLVPFSTPLRVVPRERGFAIIRDALNIGDEGEAAQCSGTVFDAAVCRAQGDEAAANNGDMHNIGEIGDIGESMHTPCTAHCKDAAFDAVVCRAEREFTVPAEEQSGEEATANRKIICCKLLNNMLKSVLSILNLRSLLICTKPRRTPLYRL